MAKGIRRPVVAGRFYQGSAGALEKEVSKLLSKGRKEKALAVIAPHAGYMYSGKVAGRVYSCVEVPDTVIILGPNHTGLGKKVSLMAEGTWEMPLGMIEIDGALARDILSSSRLFTADAEAHELEHSIEVQLPFIQTINQGTSIVPVTVMSANSKECAELGRAIAGAIKKSGKEVLIVASSDMNHYESDEVTRRKDHEAIAEVLKLDADGLLRVTSDKDITMCGVLPAAIAINAAKELGASSATVIDYATSAEVSGDFDQVVGYAGILIK